MKKKSQDNNQKRAAIYCRVSTYEQGQGEISSLKGQEDLLREYCKSKFWNVQDVFIDRASGSSLERDEIKRLLADAEDKKFDIVLATKIDRISRSVLDYLDVDKKLTELGTDIVFATQNIDTTTPAGKMQRNIMLSFAEFERDMIAERTREKLFYQASKGYWGGGHAPLGYDVIDKLLIVNESEAELVKRVFEYYLEELSVQKVAQRLSQEGFKSKTRITKSKNITGGGTFNKDSIHRILTNKVYLGKIQFKDEEFVGLHTPIIRQNIFDQVHRQLNDSRNDRTSAQIDSKLLLLGRLKCGFCGNKLTTSFVTRKDGSRDYYYKCTNKSKYGAVKCNCRDIHAIEIENFVELLMKKLAGSTYLFELVFSQLGFNEIEELKKLRADRNLLISNAKKIKSEIDNIVNFVSKGNLKDVSSISNKLEELELQKLSIEESIRKVDNEISIIKNTSIDKSDLKDIFRDMGKFFDSATDEEKKYMIKTVIREISIKLGKKQDKGDIEIHFRGDGKIKKEWVNRTVNPDKIVSSYYLDWLHVHSNSEYSIYY